MASWLSLSLFHKQDDDEDEDEEEEEDHPNQNPSSTAAKTTDLSAVISRQFRGVAAFLAPPPISPDSDGISGGDSAVSPPPSSPLLGIKNDLVEIGGSFKSKLSLISSNKAVTEISRFANSLLRFGDDEEVLGEGLGLSEEVVSFVQDISERPELWTDFPLSLKNDFDMSDIQREHVAAIEEMLPSIAALRHEICKFVNEDIFWMIYFILLLPRLNEYEAKLLSTPEIVEAREVLLHKLQEKKSPPANTEVFESVKTLKNSGGNDEITRANKRPTHENEKINDAEDSKEFEDKDVDTNSFAEVKQSEEDNSFSDIESDDNYLSGKQPGYRQSEIPSCSESSDWVKLNRSFGIEGDKQKTFPSSSREKGSESEESNEWLTIDDSDLDRPAVS